MRCLGWDETRNQNLQPIHHCSILVFLIASTNCLRYSDTHFCPIIQTSTHQTPIHIWADPQLFSPFQAFSMFQKFAGELIPLRLDPKTPIAEKPFRWGGPMKGINLKPKIEVCIWLLIFLWKTGNVLIFNVMLQVVMKIMMFFGQFPENVDAQMLVFFSKCLLNMTSDDLPFSSIYGNLQIVCVSLL